jgi:hypothetical protein
MTLFAWMLLLAASTRGELADEDCLIPAGEWRYVEVQLHQEPASVSASYEVRSGAGRVRLALMRREDLERMRDDLPHGHLAETPLGKSGQLNDAFRRRGDYAVVLDNRDGTQAVTAHLRVWLDFGGRRVPEVTELAPGRQLVVVAVSLAVFFGIVTYSGRRLWRAVKDVKKI